MIEDACSRQEFLKKFAMLSCGVLMLTASAIGCGETTDENLPTLIGIYFYDADAQKVELRGNQNVPVQTQFEFLFSTDMNTDLHMTSYRTRITFVDSNNNPVSFTDGWADARTLSLTPSANLSFNRDYIITVTQAEDKAGNPLNPYASTSAEFRTTGF